MALLFIRGEHPIVDEKYDILCHPNLSLTADGNEDFYNHDNEHRSVAKIEPLQFQPTPKRRKTPAVKPKDEDKKEESQDENQSNQTEESEPDSILLFMSDEDLDGYFNQKTEDYVNEKCKQNKHKPPVKGKK